MQILVIDDEKALGTAIKMALECNGFNVVHVEDGRTGIEFIERDSFDIVIADIFMPGCDGIDTIKALHRLKPEMPIIAISGFMFRDGRTRTPNFLAMATEFGATYRNRSTCLPCSRSSKRAVPSERDQHHKPMTLRQSRPWIDQAEEGGAV